MTKFLSCQDSCSTKFLLEHFRRDKIAAGQNYCLEKIRIQGKLTNLLPKKIVTQEILVFSSTKFVLLRAHASCPGVVVYLVFGQGCRLKLHLSQSAGE